MKKTEYDKLTSKYQKEFMNSLKEFVAINSVYDAKTVSEENPYGEGVSKALAYIENLAKEDGFKVNNYANRVVEILYGSGDKNLTIMAHADVVPVGEGWEHDPFTMKETKGVLTGRGVADDKGPLLASYYALKALKDNKQIPEGYTIRFLVGGDEERGSSCMEYYFGELKKPQPTYGFSPDSDFPLIFAEKGIMGFSASFKIDLPNVISIKGGIAHNSVIDKCEVKTHLNIDFLNFIMDKFHRNEAAIRTQEDITTVTFFGKTAHGSTPELGVNAGMIALDAVAKYTKNADLAKVVKLFSSLDGSSYGCGGKSKEMGKNSSNVGILSYENGVLEVFVNFRYVDTCDKQELKNAIKENCKPGKVKFLGDSPLLYYPLDSVLVKTLLSIYQKETDDLVTKPIATGGGTYAKEAKNTVAFGMQFPGWDSKMHSAGEQSRKEDLFKAMSIYARAIIELGEVIRNK